MRGQQNNQKRTVFFVSKTHLFTATHNVTPDKDEVTRIGIGYKGQKNFIPDSCPTLTCELVEIFHPSSPDGPQDIALPACHCQDIPSFLTISAEELPARAVVHVIDYPD